MSASNSRELPHRVDVIVVGAGGAGAPYAARLSEDPALNVLVLEAGPVPSTRNEFPPPILDAAQLPTVAGPGPHTWWHPAELAPGVPFQVGRGQGAGGSTAVNGAYFVRPRMTDLIRWAEAGNPAWAPEHVLPFLNTMENDADYGHLGAESGHGDAGPIPVSRAAFTRSPIAQAFADAADQLGHQRLADLNDINVLEGHGALPLNVAHGTRMNTGLTYLLPALGRKNLQVVGHAVVHKILLEGTTANGVDVVVDGTEHRIHAGEVVLAAGPVRSPQLLMLSGIGPHTMLNQVGVEVVVDHPGLGTAVSDHPDITLGAPLHREMTPDPEDPLFAWALNMSATGTATPGDLEVLPLLRPFSVLAGHPTGAELAVIVALQRPQSRGRLVLESADPRIPPKVEYQHLAHPVDRQRMRQGLRTAMSLLRSEQLAPWIDPARLAPEAAVFDSDPALDDWMMANLGTAVHLSGSAPMGPADQPGTVTAEDGLVHGVNNLRVVDTSVLPDVPSRGPASSAALLGERMAALSRTRQPTDS